MDNTGRLVITVLDKDMGQPIPLSWIPDGGHFQTPNWVINNTLYPGVVGTVIKATCGCIRVRYNKGLKKGIVEDWATGTDVHRLKELPQHEVEVAETTTPDQPVGASTSSFGCPLCPKICSSSSGLTLHKKHFHSGVLVNG